MAIIIPIDLHRDPVARPRPAQAQSARLLLFTGVRYERLRDPGELNRSAKPKRRKVAGRRAVQ